MRLPQSGGGSQEQALGRREKAGAVLTGLRTSLPDSLSSLCDFVNRIPLSNSHLILELDALLGADAGGEGMFDFTHLGNEICCFEQFRGSVAAGNDDM